MDSLRRLIENLRKRARKLVGRDENAEQKRNQWRKERERHQEAVRDLRLRYDASTDPNERQELAAKIELHGTDIERLTERIRANATRDEKREELISDIKGRISRVRKRIRRRKRRNAEPEIFDRSDWNAAASRGLSRNTTVTKRVLHHTAYSALSPNASVAEEAAKMRTIQAGHFARGFSDIGYHAVVFPSGRIWLARPEWAVGAHTLNHNTGSISVSADGNYEITTPTAAMVKAAKVAFEKLPGSSTKLYGHYQLNPTACPGAKLKPKIGEIS